MATRPFRMSPFSLDHFERSYSCEQGSRQQPTDVNLTRYGRLVCDGPLALRKEHDGRAAWAEQRWLGELEGPLGPGRNCVP